MITPALPILASGSPIATALVRLAREVDRVRPLAESGAPAVSAGELDRHERRALLAERASQIFFLALVCFVIAGVAIGIDRFAAGRLLWIPVAMTTLGMVSIVAGSAAVLMECGFAVAEIKAETRRLAIVNGT